MEVKQIVAEDPEDYRQGLRIVEITEDKENDIISVFDGEPEDNSLCRNFNDAYSIHTLLQKYYEFGKQGVDITFSSEEVSWDDL